MLHPSLVLSDEDDANPSPGLSNGTVDINEVIRQFQKSEEDDSEYARNVLNNLSTKDEECPICMDVMEEPVLCPICAHKG